MIYYPGYFLYLFETATFQWPANSPVFPITYVSAIILFTVGLFQLRRLGARAIVLSLSMVFAATSLFEFAYRGLLSNALPQPISGPLVNLSSIAWGFSSSPYWKARLKVTLILAVYVGLWASWYFAGYPQVYGPNPFFAYAFNVPLKIMSYGIFLVLIPSTASAQVPVRQSMRNCLII